jgi:sortase (surface protein transpeptidase)
MNILRSLAIVAFSMGVTLFAVLFFWSGSSKIQSEPAPFGFEVAGTPPAEAAEAPTVPPTIVASPTPTPFNGAVSRIKIPSLRLDYAIEQIGLLPNNILDTPHDANGKVGWYYIYDKPGFRGNALFSAHIYYNKKEGPFWTLAKTKPGDEVVVVMENGLEYHYQVIKGMRVPVEQIKMGEVIWPPDKPNDQEWITLITCGGRLGPLDQNGFGEYLDRDIVVARRIS